VTNRSTIGRHKAAKIAFFFMFMRSDELIWVSIYRKYGNWEIPPLGGIFGSGRFVVYQKNNGPNRKLHE
jgi:hypothetical protein